MWGSVLSFHCVRTWDGLGSSDFTHPSCAQSCSYIRPETVPYTPIESWNKLSFLTNPFLISSRRSLHLLLHIYKAKPGIEPMDMYMLGKLSTTELHQKPQYMLVIYMLWEIGGGLVLCSRRNTIINRNLFNVISKSSQHLSLSDIAWKEDISFTSRATSAAVACQPLLLISLFSCLPFFIKSILHTSVLPAFQHFFENTLWILTEKEMAPRVLQISPIF